MQDGTVVEFGGFYMDRHLDHPISIYVDQDVKNYGGFGRVVDDNVYGGFRNRFVGGVAVQNGETRALTFTNVLGNKGALTSDADQISDNTVLYAENSFFVVPDVALIAGIQYNSADRALEDRFLSNGDESRQADYEFWNPKAGVLWDVTSAIQVFGNISKSSEAPTFNEIPPPGAAGSGARSAGGLDL